MMKVESVELFKKYVRENTLTYGGHPIELTEDAVLIYLGLREFYRFFEQECYAIVTYEEIKNIKNDGDLKKIYNKIKKSILTDHLYNISEEDYGFLLGQINLLMSKSFEDLFHYGSNRYQSDLTYDEMVSIAND